VKFVQCAKCGLVDVAVRDDFDEDEDDAVCDECWEQLDAETTS
jgi:hypothetical protein